MMHQVLRGIAWNHSRALPPLVTTAQRFEELFPSVRILWEKRTLHEFGHASVVDLAKMFDLIIVDHTMMGDAHATGCLIDLSTLIPVSALDEIRADSLGPCFDSYMFEGSLYALPIDAAAPAASFRPDLLRAAGFETPHTWAEVLALARLGFVVMPGFPPDLFLNFMGLCVSLGGDCSIPDQLFDADAALASFDLLQQLAGLLPAETFERNPIAVYERMANGEGVAYCPFAYTYSNYSRDGFGRHALEFKAPPEIYGKPIRTVLGGTGIAMSARCAAREVALDYCLYIAGQDCQRTLYGICGGQPVRRSAWEDPVLNSLTRDFFRRTQSSIENAYVRPRFAGYAPFQEKAGVPLVRLLRRELEPARALEHIEQLYREAIGGGA